MLFVGDDWAEAHHDIEIVDEEGKRLVRRRLPEGIEGISRLHALIAAAMPAEWAELDDVDAASRVKVGIETERGPWVAALVAAGYEVFAINPKKAAEYRGRHSTSGAKSDRGDAHVLAEIVRLDRAHHRPVAGDSDAGEAIKLVARSHQTMIWERTGTYSGDPISGPHRPGPGTMDDAGRSHRSMRSRSPWRGVQERQTRRTTRRISRGCSRRMTRRSSGLDYSAVSKRVRPKGSGSGRDDRALRAGQGLVPLERPAGLT